MLPVSSGVSSALSAAVLFQWTDVLTSALNAGQHIPDALRQGVDGEIKILSAEIDQKRKGYGDLDARLTGLRRLHLNFKSCGLELTALVYLLPALNVWVNILHDLTTIQDWSVTEDGEEANKHLQATQAQYGALMCGLRSYVHLAE